MAAEGINRVYKKPSDQKSWGQLLADYIGYGGYQKSYALVIGISTFKNYGKLPTKNDPIRVTEFLMNVAGFDRVYLLTEEQATRARIRGLMIDEIPQLVDRNDRFLFYWSGHGLTRPVRKGTKGYLPLALTPANKYSEMISMDDIQRWDDLLDAAQILYLLDSCFSGLAGSKTHTDMRRITIEQMARPSRHLMTAGTAGQQTIATDRLGGSVFTTALLDGLQGAADTTSAFERDGLVSVNELEDYVKKRVALERQKSRWKNSITPQLRDLAVNEGEFFFITGEHKISHLVSKGLERTDTFVYGEPVPMSKMTHEHMDSITFSPQQIRLAQERLSNRGLNPGPVDGILGFNTSATLRQFQASEGLPITGNLDQRTWEALTLDYSTYTPTSPRPSYPPALTNSLGMEFVHIAPDTFTMGSPEDEDGRNEDESQHEVTLTQGYYLQTTEVTQGQWLAVMDNNPSHFKNCGENCPVENVSWEDVQAFIQKLNQRESRYQYRLPTEAEWEYAARSDNQSAFTNGGISQLECGHDPNLDAMGWYCGNSSVDYTGCYDASSWGGPTCAGPHPVAQKQPNDWGLYDMHGNVWEWCQDWYGDYPKGSVTNPRGPSSGGPRVVRGGSWLSSARYCRSAYRGGNLPGDRINYCGFRLVAPLSSR